MENQFKQKFTWLQLKSRRSNNNDIYQILFPWPQSVYEKRVGLVFFRFISLWLDKSAPKNMQNTFSLGPLDVKPAMCHVIPSSRNVWKWVLRFSVEKNRTWLHDRKFGEIFSTQQQNREICTNLYYYFQIRSQIFTEVKNT